MKLVSFSRCYPLTMKIARHSRFMRPLLLFFVLLTAIPALSRPGAPPDEERARLCFAT